MIKNFLYKGKRLDTKKQIYTVPRFFKFRNLFHMPIKTLKDLYLDVKYFIHRGRHGWADMDWFNLDSYLLHILPDMLEELANKGYSYSETFINADRNKVGNMTPEDWKKYLLEIAQHFRNADEEQTPVENNILDDRHEWFKKECKTYEWRLREVQKGLKMLGDNFFQLWD